MVLEVIEEQVRRGSRIYEKDHYVVLVWGNSQVRPGLCLAALHGCHTGPAARWNGSSTTVRPQTKRQHSCEIAFLLVKCATR